MAMVSEDCVVFSQQNAASITLLTTGGAVADDEHYGISLVNGFRRQRVAVLTLCVKALG